MKISTLSAVLVAIAAMLPILVSGDPFHSGEWSSCSKTCGFGIRTKTRKCNYPHNRCRTTTEACHMQACKVNETSGVPNVTRSTPPETTTTTVRTNANQGTTPSSGHLNVTSSTPPETDTTVKTRSNQDTPSSSGVPNVASSTPPETITTLETSANQGTESSSGTKPTSKTDGIARKTENLSTEENKVLPTKEQEETDDFTGSATMEREWTEELGNPKSPEHKTLKTKCEEKLKKTFINETGVVGTVVNGFSKGSVVMHFRVRTLRSKGVSRSRLQGVLASSVQSGEMKSLGISSFKISSMPQLIQESKANLRDPNSDVEQPWKFFLYGFGIMLVLVMIFVVTSLIKIKLTSNAQDHLNEDLGDKDFDRKFNFPGKESKSEIEDYDDSVFYY